MNGDYWIDNVDLGVLVLEKCYQMPFISYKTVKGLQSYGPDNFLILLFICRTQPIVVG